MKILSLYIDKWYIVGAVIDGANKSPLSLCNAEERVWLYFYSNSTTNAVNYGLSYRDEALEGKKGHYADVFDLLPDYKEYHYEKYGARKEMKDIFADADIFNDFKKSFDGQTEFPVYLSFSNDVDIVSQYIFIKALEEERFRILQYTLPIEGLALEHFERRRCKIKAGSNVLVVNACNENLSYAIYRKEKENTVLLSQRCEAGYGVDSRKQAIVEEVLEYLQAATHFLTGNPEERHEEMLYLSQFADKWLSKLDNSPCHAPVALGQIHFKKQTKNEVPVVVFNDNINDRTKNIIEKLSGKIVEMIKEEKVLLPEISHIIFLGDVFTSNTFVNSLQQKIGVNNEQIVKYSELMLPDVVGIYHVWEDNAFESEKSNRIEEAEKKYTQDRQKAVELKTRELKEKASLSEYEGRLQEAIGYYRRVLRIDPKDEYSLARIPSLETQIEQAKKNKERIDELLEKARQNFIANRYEEAVINCNEILRLQIDNVDAKKIKEDADEVIKRQRQLETYIKKMNDLLDGDKYFDARSILQKVDLLNLNDARLKIIREKIDVGIAQLEAQVKEKTSAYKSAYLAHDYQLCLRLCDELLDMGVDNTRWSEQKKIAQKHIQDEQRFQDDYDLARQARLTRNWTEVIEYATKALSIKEDYELHEWIREANNAIKDEEITRIQEEFSLAYASGLWDKVVELYDSHRSLGQKASNSSMYSNAKRFRKNGTHVTLDSVPEKPRQPKPRPKTIEQNDVKGEEHYDSSTTTKKRSGPTRPKLASRPKIEDINEPQSEKAQGKKNISSIRPRVRRPIRTEINDTTKSDEVINDNIVNNSINNKRIFYKPKR